MEILSVLFEFNPPKNINLFFTILIFTLAIVDLVKKVDLKSQIVSAGVLGTFFGVFVGLQGFDINNIEGSVPLILTGLKTAFATSILGMFVAIVLSVVQRLLNQRLDDDSSAILLDILEESKKQNSQNSKIDELIELTAKYLELNTNYNESFNKFNDSQEASFSKLDATLDARFKELQAHLEATINKLSEHATKELVDSLREIVSNFNDIITEQFGDNFKELNSSVTNLVTWQSKYKSQVESMEEQLRLAIESIRKSNVALSSVHQSYEDIFNVEEKHEKQIQMLNLYLREFEDLSSKSSLVFKNIESSFGKILVNFNDFIVNFDEFNKNKSEELTETTKAIREDFEILKGSVHTNIDGISKDFKRFLTSNSKNFESEIVDKFKSQQNITKDIVNNFMDFSQEAKLIPENIRTSLGELNGALSALTAKFKEDYEVALKNHGKLLDRLNDEEK